MSQARNRLEKHFEKASAANRKSLILFLTAGFPDMETTEQLVLAMDRAGVDVLELGIPFSDPIADGPTIQAASTQALQAGASLEKVLSLVERLREKTEIPIVLFGAFNPFLHYGLDRLTARALEAGVDGFLVPDLPMEEAAEFEAPCEKAGLSLVFLVAPTSPEDRVRAIARRSTGFLYFISLKGVTGTTIDISQGLRDQVALAKEAAGDLPVAIGFGVKTPEDVRRTAEICDAVIVGSELIRVVERHVGKPDGMEQVEAYMRSLKDALIGA